MQSMTLGIISSFLLDYFFIMIFCLIGAVTKDTYNTLTEKDMKVNLTRILISTTVSSLILFSMSDIILSKISLKMFILPCFIGGMLGFDIMEKIQKTGFWIEILTKNSSKIKEVIKEIEKNDKEEE